LLTLFAQNIFEWCIQITFKMKISSHCAPPGNYDLMVQFEEGTNTNLRVNCTPRALYVSLTSASCRIPVSLFLCSV
jgi:hypothetical protein